MVNISNKSIIFVVFVFFHMISIQGIVGQKNNSASGFRHDIEIGKQKNSNIQDGTSLDWVTLVTVSKWYDDMFQNWLFWYNLLELNIKLIVIAEDQETYVKYSNDNSMTVLKSKKHEV